MPIRSRAQGAARALALAAFVFAAAPAPRVAAEEAVVRRNIGRVSSLDPAMAETVDAAACVALAYECLLEYDYRARPYVLRPCLAESMPEISADGRTYTFKIRAGRFFGPDKCFGVAGGKPKRRELTAEDFVYSLKRLADARLSSPGYWILEGKVAGIGAFREASKSAGGAGRTDYSMPVRGLRAPDARTLVIELDAPSPDFLWTLAMPFTAAVPREAVEFYGDAFDSMEAGTGPYRVTRFRRNYGMEFERREGAADPADSGAGGGRPAGRIVYSIIDDPVTRWLAFLRGGLDIGDVSRDNWDAVFSADGALEPALAARGMRHFSKPSLDVFYVGLNLSDPVLGPNKKLRQALNRAFDSAEWVRVNRGRVTAATGPVPPGIEGRLETPNPNGYDLEAAKRLLAEAGYPDGADPATGKRLELEMELGRTDNSSREDAELFASFMARIGVSVKLRFNNWPSFLSRVSKREAQMFWIGWMADYPSALNFLQIFAGKNVSPGQNRANYENPDFDALFESAEREMDSARRLALIAEMQRIVREDCPWIFIHHRRDNILANPALGNFIPHDYPYGMEKHWRKTAPAATHAKPRN